MKDAQRYYPNHPIWILTVSVDIIAACISLACFVMLIISNCKTPPLADEMTGLILGCLGILLALCAGIFEALQCFRHIIYLKNDCVFIKKDWNWKHKRVQYYTSIKYSEITHLFLTPYLDSSKRNRPPKTGVGLGLTGPFLSFIDKNGKQKNMYIRWITKKKLFRLIDDIKERMISCGNTVEIKPTNDIIEALYKQNSISK